MFPFLDWPFAEIDGFCFRMTTDVAFGVYLARKARAGDANAKAVLEAFEIKVTDNDGKQYWPPVDEPSIVLELAGVDPTHQTDHCDWCARALRLVAAADCCGAEDEAIRTCDDKGAVTLCPACYKKAGNRVR